MLISLIVVIILQWIHNIKLSICIPKIFTVFNSCYTSVKQGMWRKKGQNKPTKTEVKPVATSGGYRLGKDMEVLSRCLKCYIMTYLLDECINLYIYN